MKKVFSILMSAAILGLVACGQSAEEKAKQMQATTDSLKKVMDDSLAMVTKAAEEKAKLVQDSLDMVAKMDAVKASADSAVAAADAKAKTAAGKAVKSTKPKLVDPGKKDQKPEEVKPGTGRG